MSPETKKQAHLKLAAIDNKIGYPDKWRDYSKLTITRGDLLGNYQRANEFESKRDVNKIEKPVDRSRMGNDSADGECLLQSVAERDRLSSRYFAAAVF